MSSRDRGKRGFCQDCAWLSAGESLPSGKYRAGSSDARACSVTLLLAYSALTRLRTQMSPDPEVRAFCLHREPALPAFGSRRPPPAPARRGPGGRWGCGGVNTWVVLQWMAISWKRLTNACLYAILLGVRETGTPRSSSQPKTLAEAARAPWGQRSIITRPARRQDVAGLLASG
jgi:hypothetical protein